MYIKPARRHTQGQNSCLEIVVSSAGAPLSTAAAYYQLGIAEAAGMGWFGLGRHPPDGEGSSGAPTAPGNGDSRPGKVASASLQSLFEFAYSSTDRPEAAGGRAVLLYNVPGTYQVPGRYCARKVHAAREQQLWIKYT